MANNYSFQTFTYKDLREGITVDNDVYGIATYEQESRKKTFLANPVITDEDAFLYIALADGIPIGRTMYYESRLKVDDQIVPLYSGSALEVVEEYRKEGIGADLFFNGQTIKKRNRLLSAGISDMALPLYKKLKYIIFEYPKLMIVLNTVPFLKRYGVPGWLAMIVGKCTNVLLRGYWKVASLSVSKKTAKYKVTKLSTIPEWVDEIILNDGHKYMEVHDHLWLQWNLDNNFKGHQRDIQSFYQVSINDKPTGFFMTKERFRSDVQGVKKVMIGSIVEWGLDKNSCIDEVDLFYLAVKTFSKDIDLIETATDNESLNKQLKHLGFIHHGDAHIAFKDRTKTMEDASDQSLWRIRYGYADVILT